MSDIVNKLWGYCHTLRHEGIGYAYYVEQLTYLLFLKMADERGIKLPKSCDWTALSSLSGSDLLDGYTDILRTLGKTEGMLGDIFAGGQNRFNNAVSLKKLLSLIGDIDWSSLGEDAKAHAYEGLLEKAASEGKKRSYKLDGLKWLKEDSLDDGDELLEPEDLVSEAIGQLEGAVAGLTDQSALRKRATDARELALAVGA